MCCILVKKTGSNEFLSSSALDYYNRFAKNRGIEKYFRNSKMLRTNRASSDSSLNEKPEYSETQNIDSQFAKSLNNLKISDCGMEDKSHETIFKSDATSFSEEKTDTSKEEVVVKKVKSTKQEKCIVPKFHSVKSTMTDVQPSSDKNVNLNLQSKIEITLPPQLQQPMDIPPIITKQEQPTQGYALPPNVPQFYPLPKIFYCAETQTTSVSEVEVSDEPIKPNMKLSVAKPDDLESSPNESVTSREQRLEWDSLGDIGYNPFLICDKSALSSTERKAIKSYLLKRGLNSTENIIVFKNSPGKQDESPKSKKRPERRRSLTYNDNWMEVYTKYKDKYSMVAPTTESKPFKPDAQSTPLDQQNVRFVEKSAQTSLINLLCKSIQVETESQTKDYSNPSSDVILPESFAKVPVESVGEDTNQTDFSIETGSFVFITGSPKKSKGDSINSSPKRSSERDTGAVKKLNPKKKRSLAGVFESQSSLKESTLQSMAGPTDSSQRSSSTNESTFKDKQQTSFDEELKMAIALMSSVVESKTMHNEMKKSLINKLMQRIVGLKISSQEQSKAVLSHENTNTEVKDKSSSASSIPSDISGNNERHAPSAKETTEESSSSNKSEKSDKIASTIKSQPLSKDSDTESNPQKTYSCEKGSTLAKIDDFVKQTLKPMTHSEVDYENHKVSSHISSSSGKYASKESSSTVSDNQDSMSKKVGQLLNIEKEIERLIKMKELMQFDLNNRKVSTEKIYENVNDVRLVIQNCDTNSRSSKNGRLERKTERSRLCTPTTLEQNLPSDLLQRKEKFVELYENQRGKLYEVTGPSEVIYTKPYGTKETIHSEPKTVVTTEKYGRRSRHSTSIASSDVLSSRSISLPMGNTITNTSTHQYDIERLPNQYTNAVETQTTDSLKRILPFFENKPRIIKNAQRTQIVDKTKFNKQIQTNCPQPIAYSIVFDNNKNAKERTNERNHGKYSGTKQSEKETRKKIEDDDDFVDTRTLKEHLNDNRPKVRHTMDRRNECIKELRILRQLRNEQRKKLLLLTSESSLKEKIRHLPPSPLGKLLHGTTKKKRFAISLYFTALKTS